jgi:hypothetical protein
MPEVFIELRATRRQEIEILQSFVIGEISEELLLKLRPVPTGNDRYLHNAQQVVQENGDVGAEGRFTGRESPVKVENKEFLDGAPPGWG